MYPHIWILLKRSAELWRYWPNRMEQPQGTVYIILCFWFELFYFWMSAFRLHETGSKIGRVVSVLKDSLLSNIVKIFHPTSSVLKLVQRFHVSRKVCWVSFSFIKNRMDCLSDRVYVTKQLLIFLLISSACGTSSDVYPTAVLPICWIFWII